MELQTLQMSERSSGSAAMSQIWRNLQHSLGTGIGARLQTRVLRQLDQSLENASESFLQATRNFAQGSVDIETVQARRQAAQRGRVEGLVIPACQALRPEAQVAVRSRSKTNRDVALSIQA
jgi:hypothetical protein